MDNEILNINLNLSVDNLNITVVHIPSKRLILSELMEKKTSNAV